MSPQFAVRIAVLGGVALIAFALIFFRLWFVEVLSGEEYAQQAETNRVREITVQAPRGKILDVNDEILVDNRTSLSLQVRPDQLPEKNSDRNQVLRRLSNVAGLNFKKTKIEIRQQSKTLPANPVTLKADVPRKLVFVLREQQALFPGITAGEVSVREYPQGELAAHILGQVTEIDGEELEEPQFSALAQGDRIGQDGLESQYDSVLRGRNGATRVVVDAFNRPVGDQIEDIPPETGNNLKLELDVKVQEAGEKALANFGGGKPGAFVAMDIETGGVLAMGSGPSYDPSIFTPPADAKKIEALFDPDQESPAIFNRALGGLYPAGSTFKPITALSAMTNGVLSPSELIFDDGTYKIDGVEKPLTNSCGCGWGSINVQRALEVSSNVFFYTQGRRLWENVQGEALQKTARELSLGSPTGIDLPGEPSGRIPGTEYRDLLIKEGIENREYSYGDNVNFAIGQGDLQMSPLTLAVMYAAVANGGKVLRPHLAKSVRDPAGEPIRDFAPAPQNQIEIPESVRTVILAGLRDAANGPDGTATQVFGGFPAPYTVMGKTGTADRNGRPEPQSWFAGLVMPPGEPGYVYVATVEDGGFGAAAAAPIVAELVKATYGIKDSEIAGRTDVVDVGELLPD